MDPLSRPRERRSAHTLPPLSPLCQSSSPPPQSSERRGDGEEKGKSKSFGRKRVKRGSEGERLCRSGSPEPVAGLQVSPLASCRNQLRRGLHGRKQLRGAWKSGVWNTLSALRSVSPQLFQWSIQMVQYIGTGFMAYYMALRLMIFALLLAPGIIRMGHFWWAHPSVLKGIKYGPNPRNYLDVFLPSELDAPPQPGEEEASPDGLGKASTCSNSPWQRSGRPCKFPVIVNVMGGAWMIGYKAWSAVLGRRLGYESGAVVICPDYRNFPQATLSDMLEDIRCALDWTFRNADKYGGDLGNVSLCAQSAGAHILLLVLAVKAKEEVEAEMKARGETIHQEEGPSSTLPGKFANLKGSNLADSYEVEGEPIKRHLYVPVVEDHSPASLEGRPAFQTPPCSSADFHSSPLASLSFATAGAEECCLALTGKEGVEVGLLRLNSFWVEEHNMDYGSGDDQDLEQGTAEDVSGYKEKDFRRNDALLPATHEEYRETSPLLTAELLQKEPIRRPNTVIERASQRARARSQGNQRPKSVSEATRAAALRGAGHCVRSRPTTSDGVGCMWSLGDIKQVISVSGAYDLVNMLPYLHRRGFYSHLLQNIMYPFNLFTASPTRIYGFKANHELAARLPPLHVLHGDKDKTIHISNAEDFVRVLQAAGAPMVELHVLKGLGHSEPIIECPLRGEDPLMRVVRPLLFNDRVGSSENYKPYYPPWIVDIAAKVMPF